ncbi:hypothetical protein HN832_01860 [archaeon]|jgi:hypothetical protein|nr:hypothetical protein [archaeon]MBT4373098.1 hypothetical protein [archaeon]MBT4531443.1 hypothetical protein [archaeon]MBT7001379.1 hypothetical protein [archaeon]MBT7282135.1 hypothetical protein [archaeon]
MVKRNGAWIDVYDLSSNRVEVQNDSSRVSLNSELSDYCDKLWAPKAEAGWTSSWLPFVNSLSYQNGKTVIRAGAMPFHIADGMGKAIEAGEDFSPSQGYTNCLSAGFPVATSDGKVIFQRRPSNVHCPNILIHEPCGYMSSRYIVAETEEEELRSADDPRYAEDKRLFGLKYQLDSKKAEIAETFGVGAEDVSYQLNPQDLLACGWKTIEMYFSTTGKINARSDELKVPEDQEVFFIPFEDIKDLIYNQGRLSKVDPIGYRPKDPRKIPLIDESLVGLIWGYERLTGDKLDIRETVERLNRDGMDITVYDSSPGTNYRFPNKF